MFEVPYHYQFRIVLIGDSTVGKSSLLRCLTEWPKFSTACDPTVGVDFFSRIIELHPERTNSSEELSSSPSRSSLDPIRIKLQIWDTAGQEKFRSITRSYYRNAVGVLLLYDITRRRTFQNLESWIDDAKQAIGHDKCVFQLVGCKCDKEEERQVTPQEGQQFATAHGMAFFETSAKENLNVEEAFHQIAKTIYAKIEAGEFSQKNFPENDDDDAQHSMNGLVHSSWEGIRVGPMVTLSNGTLSGSNFSLTDGLASYGGTRTLPTGEPVGWTCC